MPTLRYFVAVGVGAAIAFSCTDPIVSKDLRSLSQSQSDPKNEECTAQTDECNPSDLSVDSTASPNNSQLVEAKADGEDQSTTATEAPQAVASNTSTSVSEQPQEAESSTEADDASAPAITLGSITGEFLANVSSSASSNQAEGSVEDEQQGDAEKVGEATETGETGEVAEDCFSINRAQASSSDDREVENAREELASKCSPASIEVASENLQNAPELLAGDGAASDLSLDETEVAQSSAPATQQPQQAPATQQPQAQEGRAPEYLNPSANPLLFPTQSEEVQILLTEPITLEQAVELARRNNRELQQARLSVERAQAQLREALAAEYPNGNLRLDFTRNDSAQQELTAGGTNVVDQVRQLLGLPPTNDDDDNDTISTTFTATLELSYDLYTAGRRPAQIRASEEQVRLQQLELERILEQLRLNVTNGYYDLQEAAEQVRIAEAAVANALQSLRDAQLLERAGLGTRFDVLQAQVQLANNEQDLTRARSQVRIARRQLVQVLSLAQNVDVTAADPIAVAGEWDLSLEQTIILALKNRSELAQQLVQRNINEQQRRIALAANRPQASIFANYNILGVLDDDAGPTDGFSLGARLQWNFFDAGAARARARQEELDIEIAEESFAQQRNQVRFEVEQAFFNLQANADNIDTASFAVVQASESLRLARLRFSAGVGTQTDVINQQTELTRARVNQLRAVLDYNRSLAALQRAVSNLPDSTLSDVPE